MGHLSGVRLDRSLRPDDVGRRVVVRRRLADGSATDVLGELLRWDAGTLVVRDRHGADVEVDEGDILAAKTVPPPPERVPWHLRVDALEVQEQAVLGWAPLESTWLGRWLLRASEGFTGRANSVLPLGSPGVALPDALDRVRDWYAARGLEPVFQLPLPAAQDVYDHLLASGWTARDETVVMTADPAHVAAERVPPTTRHGSQPCVELGTELTAEWLATYHYRGGAELPPVAARLLTSAPLQAFASVRDDTGVVAVGRVAVGGEWAGITAMEVAPRGRRRGLAGAVLRALARFGADSGARGLYLQVSADNDAALRLYSGSGFAPHHRYRYVDPPAPPAPPASR